MKNKILHSLLACIFLYTSSCTSPAPSLPRKSLRFSVSISQCQPVSRASDKYRFEKEDRIILQINWLNAVHELMFTDYATAVCDGDHTWATSACWPEDASSAQFSAYYATGLDTTGWIAHHQTDLPNVGGNDLLQAVTEEIKYGQVIPLVFRHVTAKLILHDSVMPPGTSVRLNEAPVYTSISDGNLTEGSLSATTTFDTDGYAVFYISPVKASTTLLFTVGAKNYELITTKEFIANHAYPIVLKPHLIP